MGFFAPWFLAGLALAGLPVWLHLLRRHRNEPLPFSSLMFFERRTESSVRQRRLRYLVLFALRLAGIILLALVFAGPYWKTKSPAGAQGEKLLVLAVDNSFSMRQGGRLDRAKSDAMGAISALRPPARGQVIAFASELKLMTQPSSDPAELRAAVAAIEPSDSAGSFGQLARGLRSIAQSAQIPVELHLFSDMQKSSLPPSFSDLQLGSSVSLIFHPQASETVENWTVETVLAPRRIYGGGKGKVQATVAGYSTPAATKRVALAVDGRTIEVKEARLAPSGRATVEFLSLESPYGSHRGEVKLLESDSFPQDDRFLFAVERADPRRVLFVHEARNSRASLFYRTALESAASSAFVMEDVTADKAGNIGLEKYAFVVLSDAGNFPGGFEQELARYVTGGGGLLVLLGSAAAVRPRVPVFDEGITDTRYAARTAERFQSVVTRDETHPALRRAKGIEVVKFFQAVRVNEGKSRVVARLADSSPLLLERHVGEGLVLVFASTLDNIGNDFPVQPCFLPFVEQTARYLAHDEDAPPNFVVDSHVELREAKDRATSVEIMDPQGKRALSLAESARAQTFRLPAEGYYELRRPSGRQSLVVANADRRESDLAPMPQEAFVLWQNTGQGTKAAPSGTSEGTAEEQRRSLWWYLALLLLAAVLAESFVGARRLSRERDEGVIERREAA